MFASSIKINKSRNAGRELALTLQAFFMSAYLVVTRYWYLCTPVYWLNGRTAFLDECDRRRDRHGYLFLLLCVTTSRFLTLCRLSTAERQPTKQAHKFFNLYPAILTRILPVLASTFRMSAYVSYRNLARMVWSLPAASTSAVSITMLVLRTIRRYFQMYCNAITKNVPGINVARRLRSRDTYKVSSIDIRMQPCFRLGSHSCFFNFISFGWAAFLGVANLSTPNTKSKN